MGQEQCGGDILKIEHLRKSFKEVKAVDDLSFRVKKGELFAFLGVNGAGKSTTISIICGQLQKDSGKVFLDGKDIENGMGDLKRKLGVVFQNSALDQPLTVLENLQSRASLYGIFGKDFRNRLEELTEELGLPLNVTLHGHGTAIQSMLDFLGIESNEKRVMLSAATEDKTKALIAGQRERLHLGVPGHGIVIAVPMKSVGGGKTMEFLKGNEAGTGKYTPELNFAYELIVIIASEGQTDLVMDAARAAGARGGTVLHGKGTGAEQVKKFYNITIAEEKEVFLIVAKTEEKTAIMRSILEKAGPDTPAKAIAFSLPTTEVAGFGFYRNNEA